MPEYVWIRDPQTGEEVRLSYDELDSDLFPALLRPIGGFCYPASSFVQLDLPKVPYFVRGWLPRLGKGLLYAPPKSGKSFLTYQLARCIASGEEFLGLPTSKGRVLILQFELGEYVVQSRLKSTGKKYPNVYIGTTFSMKLDTREGKDELVQAVAEVRPDVLILDPFYKVLKGDENEAHDVLVVTDFLDQLIEEFRCSVFIIHHPGKDISKGGRGSSVLEGWVDSYIEMRRVNQKEDTQLHIKLTPKLLRHAELADNFIEATMQDFEFVPTTPTTTIFDLVSNYFTAHADRIVPVRELIGANLGSRKSINNALETLMAQDKILRVGRGEYQDKEGHKRELMAAIESLSSKHLKEEKGK